MPEDLNEADLRKAYRLLLALQGAMLLGYLAVILVFESILRRSGATYAPSTIKPHLAYGILLGAAVVSALLGRVATGIKQPPGATSSPSASLSLSPRAAAMITLGLIKLALCEITVIIGFFLGFITMRRGYAYLGFALSLALVILYFPRFEGWRDWAEKQRG